MGRRARVPGGQAAGGSGSLKGRYARNGRGPAGQRHRETLHGLRREVVLGDVPAGRQAFGVRAVHLHPLPADLLDTVLAEEREEAEPSASCEDGGEEDDTQVVRRDGFVEGGIHASRPERLLCLWALV